MEHFAERVITTLSQAQVDFVVAGGMSAVLQGASIITQDLDICYRRTPENIRRLAAALRPLAPRLRGLPAELPAVFDERTLLFGTNFTLEVADEKLDLLAEMIAIGGYEDVIGDAREAEVAGCRIKVLSLGHLIQTKRAADRPKDRAVLPELEAMLKLEKGSAEAEP